MKHTALFVVLSLCLTATVCPAEHWPQWRGPRHDAVSKEAGLPTEWSESQNVVWKTKLPGVGSGTPVVWGDRIFLTSHAGNDLLLLCFMLFTRLLMDTRDTLWRSAVLRKRG